MAFYRAVSYVTVLVTVLVTLRAQVGWRLDRFLLERFTALCRAEGLKPAEAVEEFMRRSLEAGGVVSGFGLMVSHEPRAVLSRELKAKALVSSLEGAMKDESFSGEEYADYQRLLDLLPSLQDSQLIEEIKTLAERVNTLLKGD